MNVDLKIEKMLIETELDGAQWSFDFYGFQRWTFGGRGGLPVRTIAHEIGHCAQLRGIEVQRVDQTGWGLRVRHAQIGMRYIAEPMTCECSRRETEVGGIEARIMYQLFDQDPEEVYASNAVAMNGFLPDNWNVPGHDREHRIAVLRAWQRDAFAAWSWDRVLQALYYNWKTVQARREAWFASL